MELINHPEAGYSFLKGIAPYSAGVRANLGFEISRVRLSEPLPINEDTFNRIREYLESCDRPMKALCAMELRIENPLSFSGFEKLNNQYREILAQHQLLLGQVNPIARTNISPATPLIKRPSIYAFCHTAPLMHKNSSGSFVVAGAGDLMDQTNLTLSAIVRPGDSSPDALQEKAGMVMKVMTERLNGLEMRWEDVTAVDVYTVLPIHTIIEETILQKIGKAALNGVTWHYSYPPVEGLAFEMDLRGIRKEIMVAL